MQTSETIFVYIWPLSSQVKYDNAAIAHIVHEIAEFVKTADTPFQNKNIFLRGMYEAHAQLTTCVSVILSLFILHDIHGRYSR